VLLIPAKSESQGKLWQDGVDVYLNPMGSGVNTEATEELVKYGIWSWHERTGIPTRYMGITSNTGDTYNGDVVVVFKDMLWFFENRESLLILGVAKRWTSLSYGYHLGGTIIINSTFFKPNKCGQMTIVHELGHIYGKMSHSSNIFDVMYSVGAPNCRYALSYGDMATVGMADNSGWAELTTENDVYIPSFNGMSGLLEYQENYSWELTQYSASSGSKDSVVATDSGVLLPVVKGPHSEWRVVLEGTGGDEWVLTEAR
jgi:hypothetical protein